MERVTDPAVSAYVAGQRVRIAPHHDLWMAGCRYGTIASVGGVPGGRWYYVTLDTGRRVALAESDLLPLSTVETCSFCGAVLVNEDCPNYGNGPEHQEVN